jgi:putative spermidine/putrescine transport system substrate-binding protein
MPGSRSSTARSQTRPDLISRSRGRRPSIVVALALTLAVVASACGGGGTTFSSTPVSTAVAPAPSPPTTTVPEGALDLAVPPGVFSKHVLARFERESGCVVAVQGWSASSDAAAAGLRRLRGSVDLVAVRSDGLRPLAVSGLIEPLGTGSIEGFGSIVSRLRALQSDTLNGHLYSVPYAWEPMALLSSDDAFPDGPPTSLRTLWEPARAATVALPDDPLTIATAALSVGVDDPFALDAADLSSSDELLRLARVTHRWTSATSLESLFRSDTVTLALGPPRIALALRGVPAITATIPQNGAVGLASTLALPVGAPHPVCAYRFLSYMLEPQTQAAIASITKLTPVVKAACQPLGRRACATLQAKQQWGGPGIQFARRPVAPAVPWSAWVADWDALARSS